MDQNSSRDRLSFLCQLRKHISCWAFLIILSMLDPHFRSWIPEKWRIPQQIQCCGLRYKGGLLPKSTAISTLLSVFRLFWLHHRVNASLFVYRLIFFNESDDDHRMNWKFDNFNRQILWGAPIVYREKSWGERTHPWKLLVLIFTVLDVILPSLTFSFLGTGMIVECLKQEEWYKTNK